MSWLFSSTPSNMGSSRSVSSSSSAVIENAKEVERRTFANLMMFAGSVMERSGSTEWTQAVSTQSYRLSSHSSRKILCDLGAQLDITSCKTVPGDLRNHLKAELGSTLYKTLCSSSTLTLRRIYYCQTGLEALRKLSASASTTTKSTAGHESLNKLGTLIEECKNAKDATLGNDEKRNKLAKTIESVRSEPEFPQIQEVFQENLMSPEEVRRATLQKLLNFLISLINWMEAKLKMLIDRLQRVRSLMNHDLLIIELLEKNSSRQYFIKAEKVGAPKEEAGIHIYLEKNFKLLYLDVKAVVFELDCGPDKHLTLKEIVRILSNFEKDYNLSNSCCWDYNIDASKALLRACANVPGLSMDEKNRLNWEAQDIEAKCLRTTSLNIIEVWHRYKMQYCWMQF